MAYQKEFEGSMGTVYAPWAFQENEGEKRDANRRLYSQLMERLGIDRAQTAGRVVEGGGLAFEELSPTYNEIHFRVTEKPDWMTWAEVALVCDYGNLCFGFHLRGNVIDVYTD